MWKGTQVPFHIHGEVHRSVACDTSFSEEAAIIFKMPEMDEEKISNKLCLTKHLSNKHILNQLFVYFFHKKSYFANKLIHTHFIY